MLHDDVYHDIYDCRPASEVLGKIQPDDYVDDGTGPFLKPNIEENHGYGVFVYDMDVGPYSAKLHETRATKWGAQQAAIGCNGKPFNVRFFYYVAPIEVRNGEYVQVK